MQIRLSKNVVMQSGRSQLSKNFKKDKLFSHSRMTGSSYIYIGTQRDHLLFVNINNKNKRTTNFFHSFKLGPRSNPLLWKTPVIFVWRLEFPSLGYQRKKEVSYSITLP